MKVGVDARLLSRPLTGIGRYTHELCRALVKLDNISLSLYSPAPIYNEYAMDLEAANIRTINWDSGLLRQFWSETYLPIWARKDGLDVFWGPAHRLPRCLPESMARVVTIHDLVWKYAGDTMRPLSRRLECFQMPLAIRDADVVTTVSRATADVVKKEFSIDADNLSVVPNGVKPFDSINTFKGLLQYDIDHPFFLFVGTLEPRKNLTRLLTAYSRLPASLRDRIMLVIAGGKGWGGVNISDLVSELDLVNHVHTLGYVDEATLAALYANAEFLAMPSLYEGFGLPLIEAMAYGTPVLTSNNSSMPEVAGDAGLLVDALDTDSIESGLNQLITDESLRASLADNAKNNAARFDWDESAKQLVTVFEEAISVRKSRLA